MLIKLSSLEKIKPQVSKKDQNYKIQPIQVTEKEGVTNRLRTISVIRHKK